MINVISLLGTVTNPLPASYQGLTGITIFITNIVKLITAVGGLMLFLNLIFAGLKYILSASDPKAIQEAGSSITNSILGLVIIAVAFILTAVISLLIFGDPGAILNPTVSGPAQSQTAPQSKCSSNPSNITGQTLCEQCHYVWISPQGFCTN